MSGQQPGPVPEYPAKDHDAGQPVGWGAPPPARPVGAAAKTWTLKRGLAVAGAAVVLAAGAGAGVYALTASSVAADGAPGTAAGGPAGPGGQGSVQGGPGAPGGFAGGGPGAQGGPGNFPMDGAGGGLLGALHAEYVILQGTSYVTKAEQLGTVTEVGSESVTVKSSDGFTRSYTLGADVVVSNQQQRRQQAGGTTGAQSSVPDIVAGGTVRIVAAMNGSDYTAEAVTVVAAAAGRTS